MSGFIKSARSIVDHPIVGVHNPTYHAAWNWMLHEACFQGSERFIDGRTITLRRGEFMASLAYILKALPFFSMKQLRVFLRILSENGMILVTAGKGHTPNRIFISNYNHHQRDARGEGQAEGTQRANKGQAKGNNKRREEGKKEELPPNPQGGPDDGFAFEAENSKPAAKPKRAPKQNTAPEYTADYLAVWETFPRNPNSSKVDGFKAWKALDAATRACIPLAVERYARKVTELRYAKHLSSWLNARVFEQYLDAAASQRAANGNIAASPDQRPPDRFSALTGPEWERLVRKYAGSVWPKEHLGSPPGSPLCRVPVEVLDRLDLRDKYNAAGGAINRHHPTHPVNWRATEAAA